MSKVNSSIQPAVPSAVEPSAANTVPVLKAAQLGPYQPQTGSSINPVVPRTDTGEIPAQPTFTGGLGQAVQSQLTGSMGAPSVPTDGFLFRKGPIDSHYTDETETKNPYGTVGRPGTKGWWTRVQSYANNAAHSAQDVDNSGWRVRPGQQRTSVRLNALPPEGDFGTQTAIPTQQPQAVRYNRIRPSVGTDQYGTGVLNSDTFGAGQTAGGIGGNQYTPTPGPPDTNSITAAPASPEATWG